jgi:catechol 2,3-dioxygenase-like lactoylglutathione lyase family enzyme
MSSALPASQSLKYDEQEDRMTETSTRTQITQVGTVIVPVSDQDKAIEFYTGTLGFEKRADIPFGGSERWVEVAPAGAATTIALVPPRPGEPIGIDTHVGFTSEDVDADYAQLTDRGVEADEVMRMGDPVPPMLFFRDPDGNRFMIVERS